MQNGINIAVVGALGAVGMEMIKILEDSDIPVIGFKPLDLAENAGKPVTFRGSSIPVSAAEQKAFQDVDLALFSAGAKASLELAPAAAGEGTVVIDNSSAWRMDPMVPLVVPEVNPEDLDWHRGIIANPNCSTIQMMVALKPIHDRYRIKRIIVSTYQAVSGSGQAAIEELRLQTEALLVGKQPESRVYPHPIAFNVLPHVDVFLDSDYTKEEMKMANETRKILDERIMVSATTVRVPVFRGHSEAINIETERAFQVEEIREILRKAPGVSVYDDPRRFVYPLAIEAAGRNEVFVGRIRRDQTISNGLNMWVVSDNLRKGAALNAVQIAEALRARDLVRVPGPTGDCDELPGSPAGAGIKVGSSKPGSST